MAPLGWTHLCRIYRARLQQEHDLSSVLTADDIYGADKRCRVAPSEVETFDIVGGGAFPAPVRPVELWFPRGVDVGVGYVIEVKKTRIVNGALSATPGALRATAIQGATELKLVDVARVEPGDDVTLTGAAAAQRVRVKAVSGATVTLYPDCVLTHDFEAGTTVEADTFYKVFSVLIPHAMGPVLRVAGTEILHTGYD